MTMTDAERLDLLEKKVDDLAKELATVQQQWELRLKHMNNKVNAKESSSQQQQSKRKPRILVAATGCVAAVKFGAICYSLLKWADVQGVVTENAKPYIQKKDLPGDLKLYSDSNELTLWKETGDRVLHIDLYKWADMMVIAPLSSNTLAKIAAGICDNLLTSIVKVWNCKDKPLFIAPTMNTLMWNNSLTEKHLEFVEEEMGMFFIRHKSSADSEPGPMAEIDQINNELSSSWNNLQN